MLIKNNYIIISVLLFGQAVAQTVPPNRFYDWKHAGIIETLPAYTTSINIQNEGADNTGIIPSDPVYLSVINQCTVTNQSYTVLFPAGVYTFTNTIDVKSNVKLQGEGNATRLIFNTDAICVNISGSISPTTYSITQSANRYDRFLKTDANASITSITTMIL